MFLLSPLDAFSKSRKLNPRDPGHWSVAYQGFWDMPTNGAARVHYKAGVGLGMRGGYGFGEGLSVETEFQYDLLFREKGSTKIGENKNLFTLNPGLRYTVDFVRDMSGYLFSLFGVTFDYVQSKVSAWNLSYALGGGVDFFMSDNLALGPQIKYRHVMQNGEPDNVNRMNVHLVSFGVAVTYVYD